MQFSYQNSLLEKQFILETAQTLLPYIKHLQNVIKKGTYDDLESSINLPSDKKLLVDVTAMLAKKISEINYILDIGIGGSNLGTKAIYDALFGYFDIIQPDRKPKMIFADTNDPEFLSRLKKFLENNRVLINAISKSGGTTETIFNLEIVLTSIADEDKKNVVITTDEGSKFAKVAEEKGFDVLYIPKLVGGRYSVFSAVGLFPLLACRIDINKLREGALSGRDQSVNENLEDNPAALSATILYLNYKNGKNINDNFIFDAEMESIGKWYRQLMGESIGKEDNTKGEKVYAGITPTVSIGSTDLHSMGQLYLGGPKDKITTFLSVKNHHEDVTSPNGFTFPLVENIQNKKASEIMYAILEGVKAAYVKQEQPFIEVQLEDISEKSLGEYLQFKMIEMMYLGKLMDVNPFDQPHVELYKTETKRILNQS